MGMDVPNGKNDSVRDKDQRSHPILLQMVVASVMLAVSNLHLPEYNPLQLFVSSNPHEWYARLSESEETSEEMNVHC